MYVLQRPRDDEGLEIDFKGHQLQLNGSIGTIDDVDPDTDRRVVGFRLPSRTEPRMIGRFPRGPALSFDGKTWQLL